MHGVELVLDTIVIAIVLGIAAQMLAHRLRLPAILPLLIFGMAAGPHALQLFDPHSLGTVLEVFIHLGVAVILFEGGLSLDLRQIRRIGPSLRNLLTLGVVVTGAGAAWLAQALLGLPWPTAALYGAIVTVTGPTVIAPLLRHMVAPRQVRTLLLSEGLMIDPIGAVLAYLVLQWVRRPDLELQSQMVELLTLTVAGAVLGFAAGSLARLVAQYRHTAAELRNLTILALLMGGYMIAEHQAPQSGIVAAVVMGLTLSAANIPDLAPLKTFKGQLTVLLISMLFILLSGQLDLEIIRDLGWTGVLITAGLVLLVRPLSVLLSVPPSQLGWRERALLALTAPRGIVAAAVASLAAIQLREAGLGDGAAELEGLVYLTILVTCAWSTVMALVLPRALGYLDDPLRRRLVMIGAHPFSTALAGHFRERGYQTAVIDSNPTHIARLRDRQILAVRGDARDVATYEDAGVERDTLVVALTANDELNLLVAELAHDELGIEHPVIALQRPSEEFGYRRRSWADLLGGQSLHVERWSRKIESGQARLLSFDLDGDAQAAATCRSLLREPSEHYVFLAGWKDGEPTFHLELDDLERFDALSVLVGDGPAAEPLRTLAGLVTEGRHPLAHGAATPGWTGEDETITFQFELDPRLQKGERPREDLGQPGDLRAARPGRGNGEAGEDGVDEDDSDDNDNDDTDKIPLPEKDERHDPRSEK